MHFAVRERATLACLGDNIFRSYNGFKTETNVININV